MSAPAGPVARRPVLEMAAPAERLAAFRVLATGFTTSYLLIRLPMFLGLGDRSADDFEPVGVFDVIGVAPSRDVLVAILAVTIGAGVLATLGRWYRPSAVVFALGVLVLTTLRSSFGQLLHFENLMALFALVLAVAPAADAWSLDARLRARRLGARPGRLPEPADRYGHPLVVAAVIVVATYVVAGIAKLRYGGLGWMDGDTLRDHIASAAARLDLLGGTRAPFAELAVRAEVVLPAAAVATVVLELGAPLALIDRRLRNGWVVATWAMHLGILATMAIGFPSPLFGVAFAPLFRLERGVRRAGSTLRRRPSAPSGTAAKLPGVPGSAG